MAADQNLESTFERVVANLRAELAAAFEKQAAEVRQRAAEERDAAIRLAAEAAHKNSQAQVEQERRSAQEQVDAAKRAAQSEAQARLRAEAQVEDVRRIGRTQVEEAQRLMSDRISALTRELDDSRRENAAKRTELDTAHGAAAASLTDLVRGVHSVDEADSLSAVLRRLVEAAQQHAKSASILLVQDEGLREWATHPPGIRVSERGMAIASNSSRERRRVESETAIAFPVNVGGEVVGVLYAEVGDALSPQRRMAKDALDTLSRHAGRMLETITVQQAAGLRALRRQSAFTRPGHSMGDRLP